jgi:hypothetical protein
LRLPGRREVALDADVQLPVADGEPDTAACPKRIRLLQFLEAEHAAEECTRLRLAPGRSRNLDMIELHGRYLSQIAGFPAAYP